MTEREHWSGRVGFALATIGSAVGLGSIWKFPYEVGTNGGGAFVFCYLAGVLLVVLPLMLAEFAVGRRGGADPATALARVARSHARSPRWGLIGTLGVLTGFLILSFYSVVGGWTLDYALAALLGSTEAPAVEPQQRFDALLAAPLRMMAFHAVFMTITTMVVARGIAAGIEVACKVLMPVLILMIMALAVFSSLTGDAPAAARYLFRFDLAGFSLGSALEALGLGFFSIGVGFGVMITYAGYAGREIDLREVALITIVGDTVVSLLAGFAVFPIVFKAGLDPASGPGLMFITMPAAFAQLPYGGAWTFGFYLLLFVAALASAISLLELSVAWLAQQASWPRLRAAIVSGGACWALGIVTVLSFNVLRDWSPLGFVPGFEEAGFYEVIDHLTSNLMLPAGGLLLAVFAGWLLPGVMLREELALSHFRARLLRGTLRFVVVPAIVVVTLGPLFG
ncbi:MAG TPA: sodium-dependent transporter [Beijerinckiaceae bacterium]|jgi:NSS family neurotransmitter:Na+ symporter